jgi:hypothetical protein
MQFDISAPDSDFEAWLQNLQQQQPQQAVQGPLQHTPQPQTQRQPRQIQRKKGMTNLNVMEQDLKSYQEHALASNATHPPPLPIELPHNLTQDDLKLPRNKKQKQSATSTPVIGQQT